MFANIRFQVAIDSGDGQHFYIHPWSMTDAIRNMTQDSNVGIAGHWIYRVDQSLVRLPDCFNAQGLPFVTDIILSFESTVEI